MSELFYEEDLAWHKATVKAMNMKSTLNAPLNEDEQTRIKLAWMRLRAAFDITYEVTDPIEMLDFAADVIGLGHQLQRVIHDCWSSANRRRIPGPRAVTTQKAINSALADLQALGISPSDLAKALETMSPKDALAHCMKEHDE